MTLAIIFLAIYTVSDALADSYIFRDFRKNHKNIFPRSNIDSPVIARITANQAWHYAQAIRQGAAIVFAAVYAQSWQLGFVGAAGFWIVHDVLVNTIGLNAHPFHVGTTAWLDRLFQRTRHPRFFMAAAKFVLLMLSILATQPL